MNHERGNDKRNVSVVTYDTAIIWLRSNMETNDTTSEIEITIKLRHR